MTAKLLRITFASVFGFLAPGISFVDAQAREWEPGKEIGLAAKIGPLGATREYEATPIGAADIFGNGPYDLFLRDRKLLPFKRFTPEGVPVYGQPGDFKSPSVRLAPFAKDLETWAVVYAGGKIRLSRFNREELGFEICEGFSADLPGGAGALAASMLPGDQLAVIFRKSRW